MADEVESDASVQLIPDLDLGEQGRGDRKEEEEEEAEPLGVVGRAAQELDQHNYELDLELDHDHNDDQHHEAQLGLDLEFDGGKNGNGSGRPDPAMPIPTMEFSSSEDEGEDEDGKVTEVVTGNSDLFEGLKHPSGLDEQLQSFNTDGLCGGAEAVAKPETGSDDDDFETDSASESEDFDSTDQDSGDGDVFPVGAGPVSDPEDGEEVRVVWGGVPIFSGVASYCLI